MPTDVAHERWWQIFEVIFGVPFLISLGLQLAAPLSLPRGFLSFVIVPLGAALISIGMVLAILARREFARHHQPTDPGHPTTQMITTGIFSISRNPLYLGGVCILAGMALVADLPWAFVLLVPTLVICHYVLILPEERYLSAKFGAEYRRYTAFVHRWIGRSRS